MQYIFGYGSLINPDSLKRSIADAPQCLVACVLEKYKRTWSFACMKKKYTAVTIHFDQDSSVNGVLIPVSSTQLASLDAREQGYHRIQVTSNITCKHSLHDHTVWAYVSSCCSSQAPSLHHCIHFSPSPSIPIPQSYLDCILAGALSTQGLQFAKDFIRLTHGWDGYFVNDRYKHRRYVPDTSKGEVPITTSMQMAVDAVLKGLIPAALNKRIDL